MSVYLISIVFNNEVFISLFYLNFVTVYLFRTYHRLRYYYSIIIAINTLDSAMAIIDTSVLIHR
jgi:hypothetical protein